MSFIEGNYEEILEDIDRYHLVSPVQHSGSHGVIVDSDESPWDGERLNWGLFSICRDSIMCRACANPDEEWRGHVVIQHGDLFQPNLYSHAELNQDLGYEWRRG